MDLEDSEEESESDKTSESQNDPPVAHLRRGRHQVSV